MRIILILLLLAGTSSYGQFGQLAPTDDGEQLYFTTSLRLKTEAGLWLPTTPAIYRIVEGRVERFSEPPPFSGALRRYHGNAQVSGGGQVVSYTDTTSCVGGSSCFLSYPTMYYSLLFRRGQPLGDAIGGKAQISRNERYVVNAGRWSSMEFRELRDLETGEKVEVKASPTSDRQAVTSDGRVLGFDLQQRESLILWSRTALRSVPTAETPATAIIDDLATRVIYQTKGTPAESTLRAVELSTGRDVLLARTAFQPSISNDGTLVLYVAEAEAGQPSQVFLVRPDGTGRRQLTSFPDGVAEAVLAGFGKVAFAVTRNGRLLKVETQTGAAHELISRTPSYYLGFVSLTPGSILPVRGTGLAGSTRTAPTPLPQELNGVRVLVDGQAMPLLSISPQEVWFQVPFELQDPGQPLWVELDHSSVFEGGARAARVVRRQPYFFNDSGQLLLAHQDFSALITRADPIRRGEIIHAYAVGLGPVSPEIETGTATPLDRLFQLADPFDCRMGSLQNWVPLEVKFAGLAPGMIGIYQVSVQMPESLPADAITMHCGFPDNDFDRHGGWAPTPR